MHKEDFISGLVKEIRRSKDPRLKAVTEWYGGVVNALGTCYGDVVIQENHIALITGMLLTEIRCLEEIQGYHEHERATPLFGSSMCNEDDIVISQHSFVVDFENGMITLMAKAFNSITSTIDESIVLESLVLPVTFSFEPPPVDTKVQA